MSYEEEKATPFEMALFITFVIAVDVIFIWGVIEFVRWIL